MTATQSVSSTPQGVIIKARTPEFDLEQALTKDWFANDPFHTALFNAMSLSFPTGEKEFISSVRHYEGRITDEKLLQEIRAFYRQESYHSRQHRRYNKILCEQRGYDLEALESIYIRRVQKAKERKFMLPRVWLASTVANEHFTASMAELMLDGTMLDNTDPAVADLWRWHCVEELEHKSVAFDVYTQLGGTYKLRARLMRITTLVFYIDTLRIAVKMLRHDKQLWKWQTLKSFSHFMFGKTGFVREYIPAYKQFFRKDFHPWDVDCRALLMRWERNLGVLQ